MKIKFTLIILLAMVVCMSCFGCNKDTGMDNTSVSNSDETTSESNVEETEKVKYIYRTKYIQFEFVSDEQKAEWQNALASLLNNEKIPIYEKGEGLAGYSYLYPDKPCIEIGYQLACRFKGYFPLQRVLGSGGIPNIGNGLGFRNSLDGIDCKITIFMI